jgi:hypothetical protein
MFILSNNECEFISLANDTPNENCEFINNSDNLQNITKDMIIINEHTNLLHLC